jgi:uncharacterized protein (DUF983 family)
VVPHHEPSANGKECPACGKDIGIWAIFAAGMPSRIRCPNCRARLRYDGGSVVTAISFAIVVIVVLIAHEVAVDVGMARPGLFTAVLLLITWVPIELLLAIYLRDYRRLHLVAGPSRRPTRPRSDKI